MNTDAPITFNNEKDAKSKKYFRISCVALLIVGIILIFIYNRLLPLFILSVIIGIYYFSEWLHWEYFRPQYVQFTDQGMVMQFKWKNSLILPYSQIEAIIIHQLGNNGAVPAMIKPKGNRLLYMSYIEIGLEALKRYEEVIGIPAPSWDFERKRPIPR